MRWFELSCVIFVFLMALKNSITEENVRKCVFSCPDLMCLSVCCSLWCCSTSITIKFSEGSEWVLRRNQNVMFYTVSPARRKCILLLCIYSSIHASILINTRVPTDTYADAYLLLHTLYVVLEIHPKVNKSWLEINWRQDSNVNLKYTSTQQRPCLLSSHVSSNSELKCSQCKCITITLTEIQQEG